MIDQYLQDPVVPPTDIRNVPLQPELCPKLLYPNESKMHCITSFGNTTTASECKSRIVPSTHDLNCYSFHDKIFKNVHDANDFCKNAFGKSEKYTGELAFGHFPHHENEKLPGKSFLLKMSLNFFFINAYLSTYFNKMLPM